MLQKVSNFWAENVHSRLVALIATVGTFGLIICLLIILILYYLFEEVIKGEAFAFDQSFLVGLHQYANPQLDTVMILITKLGNPEVVIPIVSVTIIILWFSKYHLQAKIFAFGSLGAALLNVGLKLVFNKVRPELWSPLITETSFSFPSGHALGSLFLYGFLAYLLSKAYPKFLILIYAAAVTLIIGVSFSRLYLGVHWPTDVIAGSGLGFLWLLTCTTMMNLSTDNVLIESDSTVDAG